MRVLIIGSGIAGLSAALEARAAGHRVILATRGALGGGSTPRAQGGIAAVLPGTGDSVDAHVADTLRAGAGHGDAGAVRLLCGAAEGAIAALERAGTRFDRAAGGERARGREAAHSAARILHAGGDRTGAEISRALCAAVRAAEIDVREDHFLAELLGAGGRVRGADFWRGTDREEIFADAVILATGGAGALYAYSTTDALATGDGVAAAARAGAALADIEFYQFHPTALARPGSFLISEAVRGEGALLRDRSGRRFLTAVHPDAELAPRDVVARAIAATMARDGGRPVDLDARHLGAERLAARFPGITRELADRGLDWSRECIPVAPAAHYWMGGIETDIRGRSTLPGLYAIGEAARTGVHGANRLASNSLLEAVVFARQAVAALTAPGPWRQGHGTHPEPPLPLESAPTPAPAPAYSRSALQGLCWEHLGLRRDRAGLDRAERILRGWIRDAPSPPRGIAAAEDQNLRELALAITRAARARASSLGAHERADDPRSSPSPRPVHQLGATA